VLDQWIRLLADPLVQHWSSTGPSELAVVGEGGTRVNAVCMLCVLCAALGRKGSCRNCRHSPDLLVRATAPAVNLGIWPFLAS